MYEEVGGKEKGGHIGRANIRREQGLSWATGEDLRTIGIRHVNVGVDQDHNRDYSLASKVRTRATGQKGTGS